MRCGPSIRGRDVDDARYARVAAAAVAAVLLPNSPIIISSFVAGAARVSSSWHLSVKGHSPESLSFVWLIKMCFHVYGQQWIGFVRAAHLLSPIDQSTLSCPVSTFLLWADVVVYLVIDLTNSLGVFRWCYYAAAVTDLLWPTVVAGLDGGTVDRVLHWAGSLLGLLLHPPSHGENSDSNDARHSGQMESKRQLTRDVISVAAISTAVGLCPPKAVYLDFPSFPPVCVYANGV